MPLCYKWQNERQPYWQISHTAHEIKRVMRSHVWAETLVTVPSGGCGDINVADVTGQDAMRHRNPRGNSHRCKKKLLLLFEPLQRTRILCQTPIVGESINVFFLFFLGQTVWHCCAIDLKNCQENSASPFLHICLLSFQHKLRFNKL